MFLGANGLDPTAFPSLLRMENEIVGLCARHLGGGPEASGSFTSGGTESLILAVKTARDWARVHRPEVVAAGDHRAGDGARVAAQGGALPRCRAGERRRRRPAQLQGRPRGDAGGDHGRTRSC
jgi:hypothetical protein